jgi:hypothetical protein
VASGQVQCFQCGTLIPLLGIVGRRDDCFKCHADLHVCKTCKFYDRSAYKECREPQADVVLEKERANFCDFFLPREPGEKTAADRQKDLLSAAEALFKKKP